MNSSDRSVASGVLVLVLLGLLEWAARSDPRPDRKKLGYLQVILGADGRISTSKTVVFFWTLILAAVLTQLTIIVVFSTGLEPTAIFGTDWSSVLLLLGGPFASAVIAKGVVVAQTNSNPGAKTVLTQTASETASEPENSLTGPASALDVVKNDAGETDLVDTQYVIFSLVAIVYFLGAYLQRLAGFAHQSDPSEIGLPVIPSVLLGLTSLAALTYVGKKAVNDQGLRVATISPNPAPPDAEVTIQLVNLAANATTGNTLVTFTPEVGASETQSTTAVADNTVTAAAPNKAGTYGVVVTSPNSIAGPVSLTVK